LVADHVGVYPQGDRWVGVAEPGGDDVSPGFARVSSDRTAKVGAIAEIGRRQSATSAHAAADGFHQLGPYPLTRPLEAGYRLAAAV